MIKWPNELLMIRFYVELLYEEFLKGFMDEQFSQVCGANFSFALTDQVEVLENPPNVVCDILLW